MPADESSSRCCHWTSNLIAILMIVVAFKLALNVTHDLRCPCEIDFYRDMGGAQSVLDGRFGEDPAYIGHVNWFNPIQPTLFAAISYVTELPLAEVYASWGPILNLLGPIAFFLLARMLLDRWIAVAALAAYLFMSNPTVPSWFQATYSPWAWPMDFAQGFFYLTVASCLQALRTGQLRWEIITGVMLGITFLTHTAPTLIIVGMMFLLTLIRLRGQGWRALRTLFVVGTVSLIVSLPYLAPLLAKYRMHVLNTAPSEYAPIGGKFVLYNLLTLRALFAGIGLVAWIYDLSVKHWMSRNDPKSTPETVRRQIMGTMLLSSMILFGYGMVAQYLQQRGLPYPPRVLPTYHFHLYLKAVESLLFAVGLAAVVRYVWTRWSSHSEERIPVDTPVILVPLFVCVGLMFPGYLTGIERVQFREFSKTIEAETDRQALYHWILAETTPTDVFLADPLMSVLVVAAADRKVVCMDEQYSNIYTNYHERFADMERLYGAVAIGDQSLFDELAEVYQVKYIVFADDAKPTTCRVTPNMRLSHRFARAFTSDKYTVVRVLPR